MNRSRTSAQSVTSAPLARQDDDRARVRKYAITMGIRMLCFVLMVLIQPYGWHTLFFAVGAVLLPYIAVVIANVGEATTTSAPERPELALPSTTPPASDAAATAAPVFEVRERRPDEEAPSSGA